jgi:hypothetical protein
MRYPDRTNGVVIVYGNHAAGWCKSLPRAASWPPGCVAVTENGQEYKAVGGNEQDGAEWWQKGE